MTRAELRAVLQDFRDMIRARGPRECLEVAAVRLTAWQWLYLCANIKKEGQLVRLRMPHIAARAALRWWRWANRDWRFVTVSEPSLHGTALYVRWYSENR